MHYDNNEDNKNNKSKKTNIQWRRVISYATRLKICI